MNLVSLTLGGRLTVVRTASLSEAMPADATLIVCDSNTRPIVERIGGLGQPPLPIVVVPSGERCKDWRVLGDLLAAFRDRGLTRDSRIVAVGGGALTDLVALAASLYLRGVAITLVPTTLLAMVDASVGGKTAIDLGGIKNLVGTFYAADEVVIAVEALSTLSDREFRSGLAEVIKAGLIDDEELVATLERDSERVLARDAEAIARIVNQAVAVKARIVADDFTEQGRRAYLNLGHTFGHALESVLGLGAWTHGEAVAWGIACAMRAGVRRGITPSAWANRVIALLTVYGYATVTPKEASTAALIDAMRHDKKSRRDGLHFVLQAGSQLTEVVPLELTFIADILEEARVLGGPL